MAATERIDEMQKQLDSLLDMSDDDAVDNLAELLRMLGRHTKGDNRKVAEILATTAKQIDSLTLNEVGK